jgi:glycosyltransferase involved in cell wall biosynthesis
LSIPNGIDTRRFWRPDCRISWRQRNGFSDQDLLIVSVARLDRQKNPAALVRAIKAIPEAQLVLVGQGDLRSELEGLPRVHLLGVRDDIPEILAASDIFALSSDWEGLPLALIEAMAAGLPVVATAVGCVPEVVEDGVSGLLIGRGNQAELVAALISLAHDSGLRSSLGKAARRRSEVFSLQAMVSAYEQLFAKLLSSTASGSA